MSKLLFYADVLMTILLINVSQRSDFVEKPNKRSKKEGNILITILNNLQKSRYIALFSDLTLDSASICLAVRSAKTCILLPCMSLFRNKRFALNYIDQGIHYVKI